MSTYGLAQRQHSRKPLPVQVTPSTDRYSTYRDARNHISRGSCAGPTFPPPRNSSRLPAGTRAVSQAAPQHTPRKVVKPSPATQQPRTHQADAMHWDNLRSQGYVLRGSASMSTVTQAVSYQHNATTASPNIRYIPDPVYYQHMRYQVHPNLRTTPHIARPSGHPAPDAAFLSQARYAPAPQQTTPYPPTPQRPKLHSQASNMTMRTLRAQQDRDKCQLRPGSIFMYERPSKASYLENEEIKSRGAPSRPSSRAASASGSHHEARSSSRLSRHSASLPFIPFQPDYPPTESLHASLNLPSRPASRIAQSTPLLRQETDVSFYSQSTFPDSYMDMVQVQHARNAAPSRVSTHRSALSSVHRASYPLETARTEMTLGTAQDLWRDLYHELLSTDDANDQRPSDHDYASLETPRLPDLETSTNVEYDFRHQSMALRSPSPVPIQRLKSTKKARDPSSDVRPRLLRQSPVRNSYEDTAKQVVERARRASSTATSPGKAAMSELSITVAGGTQSKDSPTAKSTVTVSIAGDTQAVGSLTRLLRAKTPAAELFEDSAMQQLALQSAPSEVGSEDEYSSTSLPTTSTESDREPAFQVATVTSPIVAQGTLKRLSAVGQTSQSSSTPQQCVPTKIRASRIPVPIGRRTAKGRS